MTATLERTEQGYARAAAGPSVGARIRSARWFLIVAGTLLLTVLIALANRSDTDTLALSLKNYDPNGARALGEVAKAQGLDFDQIDTLSGARITAPDDTTLVIADGFFLQGYQARSILAYPGPIVVLGDAPALLDELDASLTWVSSPAGIRGDRCSHPAAAAAGTIAATGSALAGDGATEECFPSSDGAAMLVYARDDAADVVVIADPTIARNDRIDVEGHAALMLWLVGAEPRAVWYLGSLYDTTALVWSDPEAGSGSGDLPEIPSSTDFLPPGTGNAVYALAFALVVAAWWKARRFGALVTEPLPVVIRAAEATRGRARLYRVARATGRASAALRAAAALRMARRLGLGRSTTRATLVATIARGAGRTAADVDTLLYGPPPRSESEMMGLVAELDRLESEVHRT